MEKTKETLVIRALKKLNYNEEQIKNALTSIDKDYLEESSWNEIVKDCAWYIEATNDLNILEGKE